MNQASILQQFIAAIDADNDEQTEALAPQLTSGDETALLVLLAAPDVNHRWWAARALALWGTLANSLTEIDADGNVVGDVAESFEPADGAKKWVFKVRKGITFHNGRAVTADDVVASLLHHTKEDSKSAAKSLLKEVTSFKADGPDTVVIELSGGNADFPYTVSDYHMPIMPKNDDGSVDWQSGIRTGPYKLDKFDPGVTATKVLGRVSAIMAASQRRRQLREAGRHVPVPPAAVIRAV